MQKENNSKKVKFKKKIIVLFLIIIIIVVGIFLYSNIIDFFSLFEQKELYAEVRVSSGYGLAVNGSALIFGMMPPGSGGEKIVYLNNIYNKQAKVKIYSQGSISDFLNVSDNNFVLNPNEGKNLTFTVKIPKDAPFGTYDGKVTFVIRNSIVK